VLLPDRGDSGLWDRRAAIEERFTVERVSAAADEWRKQVERHFRFLEDHGYRLARAEDESPWGTVVVYESSVNAVLVKRSVEFGRVEVELARLDAAGELPPVEVWVSASPSGRALLDNVLAVRDPNRDPWKRLKGLRRVAPTRSLRFWAGTLREVCPDFLSGSDACLAEAHAAVWARVQKEPQVMRVHLPSSATAGDEAAAVAEARAETPEHVKIGLLRYRHPGRR
jgi:hypothetical protein